MAATRATAAENRIEPQEGPQTAWLSSPADIAVFGGSAGGGKSYALLMEAARHVNNPRYGAVIFRRTRKQIRNEGGLWDDSTSIYPGIGAGGSRNLLEWRWPSGSRVKLDHLQHEKDKFTWQGASIPMMGFDELTHFTESQFFYMLSRSRSVSGIRPYVRATTNPDANSWVKRFLAPWVDRTYPDPADSGEIRWFVRDGDKLKWVPEGTPDAKSVTFVRSSVFDNKKLLEKDPGYLSNLKALPRVDRLRLLHGDWDVVEAGNMFWREWFGNPGPYYPPGMRLIRYWDLAASEVKEGTDPDWTAGVLMGHEPGLPLYWILDVVAVRNTPGAIERLIAATAAADQALYGQVEIVFEQEPGSAGVIVVDHYTRNVLPRYHVRGDKVTGNQVERVKPLSAAAEKGQIRLVAGPWNDAFLNEAVAYPGTGHDDRVAAASGAYNLLAVAPEPTAPMAGGTRLGPLEALRITPGIGLMLPERNRII